MSIFIWFAAGCARCKRFSLFEVAWQNAWRSDCLVWGEHLLFGLGKGLGILSNTVFNDVHVKIVLCLLLDLFVLKERALAEVVLRAGQALV